MFGFAGVGRRSREYSCSPFYARALRLDAETASLVADSPDYLSPFPERLSPKERKEREEHVRNQSKLERKWKELEAEYLRWQADEVAENDPMQKGFGVLYKAGEEGEGGRASVADLRPPSVAANPKPSHPQYTDYSSARVTETGHDHPDIQRLDKNRPPVYTIFPHQEGYDRNEASRSYATRREYDTRRQQENIRQAHSRWEQQRVRPPSRGPNYSERMVHKEKMDAWHQREGARYQQSMDDALSQMDERMSGGGAEDYRDQRSWWGRLKDGIRGVNDSFKGVDSGFGVVAKGKDKPTDSYRNAQGTRRRGEADVPYPGSEYKAVDEEESSLKKTCGFGVSKNGDDS